jgi:hypothetical protein
MKKFLLLCVLATATTAAPTASAADPTPADVKNAAKYCKALRAAADSNFASMFGTRKNAYGKCVSSTARKTAREDAAQRKEARENAAVQCRAEREDIGFAAAHDGKTFDQFYGDGPGRNAYGKCVSTKAKQLKQAADEADEAQGKDRVNAARSCKQARRDDREQFEEDYGTHRNAFGKCVSRTARERAAERSQPA